jgi:hypothetical protein
VVDLLVGFVIFTVIQLLATGVAMLFSVNLIENWVAVICILAGLIVLFDRLSKLDGVHTFFEKYYKPYRAAIIFAVFSALFFITILFDMILYHEELFSAEQGERILLMVIGFFVLNLGLGIVVIRMDNISKERTAIEEYGKDLQNIVKDQRRVNHDHKNHLQMILSLNEGPDGIAKVTEIRDYIEKILGSRSRDGDITIIKDDVLISAMLNQKKQVANQKGIVFTYSDMSPLSEYKIPNTELIDILLNLIENAFEEVETLDKKNRAVNLVFGERMIEVSNTVSARLAKNEDNTDHFAEDGYSTKGSGRGFGLGKVYSAAKTFGVRVETGIFANSVHFKLWF